MTKTLGWIVFVVVLIGGIWYFFLSGPRSGAPAATTTPQTSQGQTQNATAAGTSDAALNQDAASIDAQLQAASTDGASAQSFNDTPIVQNP